MQVKSIEECSRGSILQYVWPSFFIIKLKFRWLQTCLASLKNTKHLILCLWQMFYDFIKKSQFLHFSDVF